MPDPVSSIRNLGPASDAAYARAGITSVGMLREMGADAGYEALCCAAARDRISSPIMPW
jgi:hypothetical protein